MATAYAAKASDLQCMVEVVERGREGEEPDGGRSEGGRRESKVPKSARMCRAVSELAAEISWRYSALRTSKSATTGRR